MFDLNFTDVKVVLGVVAGVIAFLAYIVYVVSILRGKSKPNSSVLNRQKPIVWFVRFYTRSMF